MLERRIPADDGAQLWMREQGPPDGVPVILSHGGPGASNDLEPIADMISDFARVVLWDQRGGGRSSRRGPYQITRFVRDLDQIRASCGIERCVPIGHSWGANLSIHYAQANPHRVRAVGYLCGTGLEWWPHHSAEHKRNQRARLGPSLGARLAELHAKQRDTAEQNEYRLLYLQSEFSDRARAPTLAAKVIELDDRYPVNYEANAALNAQQKALDHAEQRRMCSAIEAPVFVIRGLEDPRPSAALDSLLEALPNTEYHALPGSGHFPWLEQREQLAQILQRLIHVAK